MKLSAAIELMLTSGEYNRCNQYMCNVLAHSKQGDFRTHVEQVKDMMQELGRQNGVQVWRGDALACVLHELGYYQLGRGFNWFPYNQELYMWWVFDLKRKGL